jgi:hypothetical protein
LEFPNSRGWIDLLDFSQQLAIPLDSPLQLRDRQADGKTLYPGHNGMASVMPNENKMSDGPRERVRAAVNMY